MVFISHGVRGAVITVWLVDRSVSYVVLWSDRRQAATGQKNHIYRD